MRRFLIVFGIIICAYLGIGIIFRLTCLTIVPSSSFVYIIGEDHYHSSSYYEVNETIRKFSFENEPALTLLNALFFVYHYPIGMTEKYFWSETFRDASFLNSFDKLADQYSLKNGAIIHTCDSTFEDSYIIKKDGSYIIHSLTRTSPIP